MNLSIPKISLTRFLIFLSIVAYFAFGDYSRYVYVIKVAAIVGLIIGEKRVHLSFHLGWVLCFLACEALSLLWSRYTSNSVFYIVWTLQAMALAWAMGNAMRTKADMEFVLKSIFIAGVVLSVRVLLHTTIRELGSFRVGANMGYNANELAMKCAISFNAGYYFMAKKDQKRSTRLMYAALAVITLMIVIFTGSRKGAVMAVAGMVIAMTFRAKSPAKFLRNIGIAVGAVAVFLVVVTQVEAFYRVLGRRLMNVLNLVTGEGSAGNSIANRLSYAQIGLELFAKKPLLGYGTGSFMYVSGIGLYAHNNYIQLMVDLGLVGLLVYYTAYVYNICGLVGAIRQEKELSSVLLALTGLLVVLEVTLVSFQNDYVQLILALGCAYIRLSREDSWGLEEVLCEF